MYGDAYCSLAYVRLTIILLIGSIIYNEWKGGWWIDSSVALILACFFAKEGIMTLRRVFSKEFDGRR